MCNPAIGEVIPQGVLEQLHHFLQERKSGQFTLHVDDGKIRKIQESTWTNLPADADKRA